jgi:hypothetical protein
MMAITIQRITLILKLGNIYKTFNAIFASVGFLEDSTKKVKYICKI